MATFHPDPPRIPGNLHGERMVLGHLRSLPDEAHVLVRLSILDDKTNLDREIDFLVLHPELGLLLIEVKGGRLTQAAGRWHRLHKDELQPLNESPEDQMHAQQYALLAFLMKQGGFVPQVTRILALPHMKITGDLAPDLPRSRVLDQEDLKSIGPSLRRAVAGTQSWEEFKASDRAKHHRISATVLSGLLTALLPAQMAPPSLPEILAEEGEAQDAQSAQLLDHLASNFAKGRFRVQGGPGSGKSWLGRKVTRLWAAEGRQVLSIAFNKALVYATQIALDEFPDMDIATCHDFMKTRMDELHVEVPFTTAGAFFETDLPAAFAAHVGKLPKRWDALVVDEAQDLDPAWVDALRRALRDPDHDPILMLEDPAQNIYRTVAHTLGVPWRLDRSLRQHPALARATWEALPACGWPEPPKGDASGVLTLQKSSAETWKKDLQKVLEDLHAEGIQPEQVLVLAAHRPEETLGLKRGQRLGPWRLNTWKDWWDGEVAGQVRVGTVQAFKGLEADIVIYLAPATRREDTARLRYCALSRARHRAIVLEKAIPDPERPVEKLSAEPAPPPVRFDARQAMAPNQAALLTALKAKPGSRR